MTQRKRWLKTRELEKGVCVAVRRPGKADTAETRNDIPSSQVYGVWAFSLCLCVCP